ncbi:MAG TPA: c-type cytochrome biogenesis protein CcsB [Symbiobacteriaceae bacterium]|nr:c-type cytochrome biogenesis protein CcsB [Symbiobacteriaceae bacterium]
MMALSGYLFAGAFAAYVISALLYIARITLRRSKSSSSSKLALADRLGDWAFRLSVGGVLFQGGAIVTRWVSSSQAPMSNMFEYMSFLGWSVMLFFVLISYWYKLPGLGAFVAPVGVIVIAYASVFPTDVKPLVPVLQSYWLVLHVTTAALGEGAFAVSFGAALMYLLRMRKEQTSRAEETILEFMGWATTVLVGFIVVALGFKWTGGYAANLTNTGVGSQIVKYTIPPLVGPVGSVSGEASWLGMDMPIFNAPAWMNGANAGRQLNTLFWSLLVGTVIYMILRILVGPLREVGSKAVAGMNPKLLDEVSYRGVAVGFPLFTLGGIVFAMIWAQKAWGSYWSWDPKETWALITWLFYSGYLHMRIVRNWEGRPAAWVSAAGFPLVLFTLVGVNLLISGLHSYAG